MRWSAKSLPYFYLARAVSNGTISAITGKLLPELQAWRERDLEALYPKTEVQLCIIRQIRNSMKYVASKNQKAFMADLKCLYKAATLNAAELALDKLEGKWGK
jgi:transposase-like protein